MSFTSAIPLTLALTAAGVVALAARQSNALTGRGAAAAALLGATILAGTGVSGGIVLLLFFISSTALSRRLPDPTVALLDPKGSERDQWQVLANGGVAGLGGLIGLGVPAAGFWIVTSSLAAAAADTWATAWGADSASSPRLITTGRAVAPGTSGGVTWRGTLGGVAGALLVAGTAALVTRDARFLGCGFIGFIGMAADSMLGAHWQGKFRCPQCRHPTERRVHRCGTPTVLESGKGWLSNDGVNALATALAGTCGWLAWRWVS